jgi:hypothetical protein
MYRGGIRESERSRLRGKVKERGRRREKGRSGWREGEKEEGREVGRGRRRRRRKRVGGGGGWGGGRRGCSGGGSVGAFRPQLKTGSLGFSVSVIRDLLKCQKRPVSKETYYSVKRDLEHLDLN